MRAHSFLRRLSAVVLCLAIPASGRSQVVRTRALSSYVGGSSVGPAGVGSSRFLKSLELHLDQVILRTKPSLAAQEAPEVDRRGDPAAAEYLSKAALELDGDDGLTASYAARVLAKVLADPEASSRLAGALRGKDTLEAGALALKLEAAGDAAGFGPLLAQAGEDLMRGPEAARAEEELARIFDGRLSLGGALSAPATPEEFAAYAERRFSAGRLKPGKHAAVIARTPGAGRLGAVVGDEDLYGRIALSPLTNAEREKVIIDLFLQAGARQEEIGLQDAGEGRHNVIVVKKGRSDRVIVVGGHHDKVSRGHGVIDNWTGATMVVNTYQALRDMDTEATYIFVAFAREEEGLIGSREFVRNLSRAERAKIDSMINLDTLAVDGTFSWKNNSDESLLKMVMRTAKEKALDLLEMTFWGGDADSSTFRQAGIPAITLLGASEDVIFDIIHSANDTVAAFSLPHYKNAYLLVVALLGNLDGGPVRRGPPARFSSWLAGMFYPSSGR